MFTSPVAYKGIAICLWAKTLKNLIVLKYFFHSVYDHMAAEEDDSEEDHHIQPVFGSTVHAAGFPDCWNCCPGIDRTWRLGRIVELISQRASSASRFISQVLRTASGQSGRNFIGASGPGLFEHGFHNFSYLRLSCQVETHEWSSCAIASRCLQKSSSHPIFDCEFR